MQFRELCQLFLNLQDRLQEALLFVTPPPGQVQKAAEDFPPIGRGPLGKRLGARFLLLLFHPVFSRFEVGDLLLAARAPQYRDQI